MNATLRSALANMSFDIGKYDLVLLAWLCICVAGFVVSAGVCRHILASSAAKYTRCLFVYTILD